MRNTTGAEFTYTTYLSLGHHEYHFEFSDGEFDVRIPLETGEELYGPVIHNIPPEAKIDSPAEGDEFTTDDVVMFDASSSYDQDDDNLTFLWTSDLDGLLGSGVVLNTNLSEGKHEITLTVSDGFDGNSTDEVSVTVIRLRPNLEATITTQPVIPVEGQKVAVVATVRNTGDAPAIGVDVTVLLGDLIVKTEKIPQLPVGGNHLIKCEFNATEPGKHTVTVSFAHGGNFTLRLTVKARDGPVAEAGNNVRIDLGGSVTFDGSESSSAGSIVSYLWDFGDRTNATGKRVTHVFAKAGTFTVTLTVTDDDGAVDTDTVTISVITPEEAIEDLISFVEELGLPKGLENALIAKLDGAIEALENGQDTAAKNKLGAFINLVEAQSGKKITVEDAGELIDTAEWIIENI